MTVIRAWWGRVGFLTTDDPKWHYEWCYEINTFSGKIYRPMFKGWPLLWRFWWRISP